MEKKLIWKRVQIAELGEGWCLRKKRDAAGVGANQEQPVHGQDGEGGERSLADVRLQLDGRARGGRVKGVDDAELVARRPADDAGTADLEAVDGLLQWPGETGVYLGITDPGGQRMCTSKFLSTQERGKKKLWKTHH